LSELSEIMQDQILQLLSFPPNPSKSPYIIQQENSRNFIDSHKMFVHRGISRNFLYI